MCSNRDLNPNYDRDLPITVSRHMHIYVGTLQYNSTCYTPDTTITQLFI